MNELQNLILTKQKQESYEGLFGSKIIRNIEMSQDLYYGNIKYRVDLIRPVHYDMNFDLNALQKLSAYKELLLKMLGNIHSKMKYDKRNSYLHVINFKKIFNDTLKCSSYGIDDILTGKCL